MVVIMLGAPGTGKGTIAGILTEKLNAPQVSTGDIFRKNIKEGTELGKLAEQYIAEGKLVPDEVTIGIVKDRLQEKDVENGIILDGFPRTVHQAEELDKILEKEGKKESDPHHGNFRSSGRTWRCILLFKRNGTVELYPDKYSGYGLQWNRRCISRQPESHRNHFFLLFYPAHYKRWSLCG